MSVLVNICGGYIILMLICTAVLFEIFIHEEKREAQK